MGFKIGNPYSSKNVGTTSTLGPTFGFAIATYKSNKSHPKPPPPLPEDKGLPPEIKENQTKAEEIIGGVLAQAREQATINAAMQEGSVYAGMGISEAGKAGVEGMNHTLNWLKTVNKQEENRLAQNLGLDAPNPGVDSNWQSFTANETDMADRTSKRYDDLSNLMNLKMPDEMKNAEDLINTTQNLLNSTDETVK